MKVTLDLSEYMLPKFYQTHFQRQLARSLFLVLETFNSQPSTVNSQITIQVDFLSKVWLRCCLAALRKSILVRIRIAVL